MGLMGMELAAVKGKELLHVHLVNQMELYMQVVEIVHAMEMQKLMDLVLLSLDGDINVKI